MYLVTSEISLIFAIEHNYCVAIPFEVTNFMKMLNQPLLGSIKMDQTKNTINE